MRAQHASNEPARRKVPANGKPKRKKKVSPYTQAALAWWRVGGSWYVDASLCTKREPVGQLEDLLRRRAFSRHEVQDELVYTEGVNAETLLHSLMRATVSDEWPERFDIVEDREAFKEKLVKLGLWLPIAQDGKADLHFMTWGGEGLPDADEERNRQAAGREEGCVSWLFSQVLVVACWGGQSLDGVPSALSRLSPIPRAFLSPAKMTACSRLSRFSMTFESLTEGDGEAVLTSFLAAFPVRTSVPQGKEQALRESEADYGRRCSESFARYDRDSCSWRTLQCSLLGDSEEFSATWPRSGSMRSGMCSERTTSARRTSASGCGFWPTPTVHGNNNRAELSPKAGDGLATAVRRETFLTPQATDGMRSNFKPESLAKRWDKHPNGNLAEQVAKFPTPTCQDAKNNGAKSQHERNTPPLNAVVGGALNPPWVEWLMGWPLGWTDLQPWGTDKFQWWQRWLSAFCMNVPSERSMCYATDSH